MRKWILFLTLFTLLLCLPGCSGKQDNATQQTKPVQTAPVSEHADFEEQLRQEAFPADDDFMVILGSAVKYCDFSSTEEAVTFTVRAPYIYVELVSWYETLDSLTEIQLQDKVRELLQGAPVENRITLNYTLREDGGVEFQYTEAYLNAAGCGLREFYGYLYGRLMSEIGVDGDG